MFRCPARSGFSLTEVLVVLAILGLLAAVIVPAVQKARESARRVECSSRIAQLGRALHNFESANRKFPSAAGGVSDPGYGLDQFAPHVRLLPYIEQKPLFDSVNLSAGVSFSVVPTPRNLAEQKIAAFLCPSDPVSIGNNYRCSTGPSAYPDPFQMPGEGGDGAFNWFAQTRVIDFADGMSNTIGMSEKIKGQNGSLTWDKGSFWYSGIAIFLGTNPPTNTVIETCGSLTGPPPPSLIANHGGNAWIVGVYDSALYNHALAPNPQIPDCSILSGPGGGFGSFAGVFAARSYHSGVVNVLLMDGAVRVVNNVIDKGAWQALSTRAGADPVGEF
jgi:prepilin-type N-terminal cleavage/methylation domain-containing protein